MFVFVIVVKIFVDRGFEQLVSTLQRGVLDLCARYVKVAAALQLFQNELHVDISLASAGNGDRIAQLVIMPYLSVSFSEVDELSETARGDGGFGSTGK